MSTGSRVKSIRVHTVTFKTRTSGPNLFHIIQGVSAYSPQFCKLPTPGRTLPPVNRDWSHAQRVRHLAGGGGGPNANSDKNLWLNMIHKLQKMSLLPVVVFCFSKKRCDSCVDGLRSLVRWVQQKH